MAEQPEAPLASPDAPDRPRGRKSGRKLKMTPEARQKVLQALKGGHHRSAAAAFAGVSRWTLYRFIDRAEKARRKFDRGHRLTKAERDLCLFCTDLEAAEVTPEVAALDVIAGAIRAKDVNAAFRFLEARYRERWGRQTQIANAKDPDHPEKPGEPLKLDLSPGTLAGRPKEELLAELANRGIAPELLRSLLG